MGPIRYHVLALAPPLPPPNKEVPQKSTPWAPPLALNYAQASLPADLPRPAVPVIRHERWNILDLIATSSYTQVALRATPSTSSV